MQNFRFFCHLRSLFLPLLLLAAQPLPTLAQTPSPTQPSTQPPTLPLPTPSQLPASPTTDGEGYILGAGDQIAITVFGYEEFTGSQVILPDGTINLPLLGSVPVAGQTPTSLSQGLIARLQPYLVDPVVTVSLSTLRPVIVNVSGEVQRPGPVQLRSLTTNIGTNNTSSTTTGALGGVPTVSSALIEAGGVTRDADIRQVVVRRNIAGREPTTIALNLWDAVWSENSPQDLILQAGDSVYVPQLTADAQIDRRLVARSSFAPRTVRVRVVGQVNAPGEVQVSPDSTVSSAVAIAGGPTTDARLSEVQIVRLNQDGSISNQPIDLRNLQDNFQIQEGDVVVVPERGTSSFLRSLGQIITPIGGILGILQRITGF